MTKRNVRSVAIFLCLLFTLVACATPEQVTPEIVVTGQADGAPAGCGVQEIAQRLLDFATAFNRGDPQLTPAFFNSRAPFAWYSAPDGDPRTGGHVAVYSAKELPAYFERRQAQHEQPQFKRIKVNGWESGRGLVHFEFTVNRQADDLNGGAARDVMGKGALHCQTQAFVAFSIGDA
jgi:hypothetical protein